MIKKMKVLLVLVSLSLTLGLMSNTYSRYIADATGDLKVLFAKWQILVNETDITNNSSTTINFVPVIEENEFVTNNTIAPSSKGYFDIDIDPSNVEVSFNYTITLDLLNEDMPDLMITKYAILNNTYLEGDEVQTETLTTNSITGTLQYDNSRENFQFEPFTVRVYFEWYEGENESMNDAEDSIIGQKAATEDTSLQIKTTIHFEQKIN